MISQTKSVLKMSLDLVYAICLNLNGVSFSRVCINFASMNFFLQAERLLSLLLFLKLHCITSGPEQLQDTNYSRRGQKDMQRVSECDDDKHSYLNHNSVILVYSRGTKVAYRAKTHIFCTRKVYGWNFVY